MRGGVGDISDGTLQGTTFVFKRRGKRWLGKKKK